MPIKSFAEVVATRRSIYSLTDDLPLTEDQVADAVCRALEAAPSPFDSQSARVAVLFGRQHHRLWESVSANLTAELTAQGVILEETWAAEERIDGFADGAGTLLFFDDEEVTRAVAGEHPELDPAVLVSWMEQANAMLQFSLWNILEDAGVGASLQHYNEQVAHAAVKLLGLPVSWRPIAQMPFGSFDALPPDRAVIPGQHRMRVFK